MTTHPHTDTIAESTKDDLLRDARAMLRDLEYGWPTRELHRTPTSVIEEITALLNDFYDMETGDCTEGTYTS